MFRPVEQVLNNSKHTVWQHKWSDGSRLELSETPENFILIEYDSANNPIPYMLPDNYGSSIEERYPKRKWKYHNVLEDIKDEYDLGD